MPIRLLLVEDDTVSRSFLSDALAGLPAEVDAAQDIAEAVRMAGAMRHDLWLVDAHLPDGDGIACLLALRRIHDTPALAITAGAPREELDRLCASGFLEVLLKPVSMALLQATVRRLLGYTEPVPPKPDEGKLPLWDEVRALAAIGGSHDALLALRKIFLDELPSLRSQVMAAKLAGDEAAMQNVLHKLKASCGFVGASRLLQAVEALGHSPLDDALLKGFEFAAADALAS